MPNREDELVISYLIFFLPKKVIKSVLGIKKPRKLALDNYLHVLQMISCT